MEEIRTKLVEKDETSCQVLEEKLCVGLEILVLVYLNNVDCDHTMLKTG